MTVAKNATIIPIVNEFLIDSERRRNVSCPRLVVPRKCSVDGGRFLGYVAHVIDASLLNNGKTKPMIRNIERIIEPHHNRKFQYFKDLNMDIDLHYL
jgi:hypothetical protein